MSHPKSVTDAAYLLTAGDYRELGPANAEVAFVGRSNCGKSSMINALCRKANLARVSNTPGRTQTINVYETAKLTWIVDLPGYGYAAAPAAVRKHWASMIENYLTHRPSLRCVFMIVDAKVGATALDLQMAEWLSAAQIPVIVLANKADQVKSSQQFKQRQAIAAALKISPEDVRWVSAREGTGINALRTEVSLLLK